MRSTAFVLAWCLAVCVARVSVADVTAHNGFGALGTEAVMVDFSETHNTAFNFGVPPFGAVVPVSGTQFSKTFHEIARHELAYEYRTDIYSAFAVQFGLPFPDTSEPNDGDGMIVEETITNDDDQGRMWGGYRFGLMASDIYTSCEDFCEFPAELGVVSLYDLQNDPTTRNVMVSDVGFTTAADLGTIEIMVTQDVAAGEGPIVELTFQNPLEVGESFNLSYLVNYLDLPVGIATDGFTLFQEPIQVIPAPGAAVLAMLGFGTVGWVRRRLD